MELAFHHEGVADHFGAADEVMQAELAEEWLGLASALPPYVPCRCVPRNVVMQDRHRVLESGEVEHYLKPRITTNLSYGPDPVNGGVPKAGRSVRLPSVQGNGRAHATTAEAARRAGRRSGRAGCDIKSAYRLVTVQAEDRWLQVCVWTDGFHDDRRLVFGGSHAPQRFERTSVFGCSWAQRGQDAFDDANPLPPEITGGWTVERAQLQREGVLPGGEDQLRPRTMAPFIDDANMSAIDDTVVVPPELAHIPVGEATTRAVGGTPAADDSRLAVHVRIAVARLTQLGFEVSHPKTQAGDRVVELGFLFDTVDSDDAGLVQGKLRIPDTKRTIMLHQIDRLRTELIGGRGISRVDAEQFTGRMCNLAQVGPELRAPLAAGYRLSLARRKVSKAQRANGRKPSLMRRVATNPDTPAARDFGELLDVSEAFVDANEGVSLAPASAFADLYDPQNLIVTTDASGDDGVGGYAFHPLAPDVVWLVSSEWPDDVREALRTAALPKAERTALPAGTWMLSMPAAELFGQWAVAEAAGAMPAQTRPPRWSTVTAIGDCDPAAAVLNAASSRSAQMRLLVRAAREHVKQWLGVSLPREWNFDADRLSHPSQLGAVYTDAQAAGLDVRLATIPDRCWMRLRAACSLPMAREESGAEEA